MKLLVANWKMNPERLQDVKAYFSVFKRKKKNDKGITTVFCPPYTFLHEVARATKSNRKIFCGVQDVFWKEHGSYTGEIGISQVKDAGAKFVIVGHSERRAMGEDTAAIQQKVAASLEAKLHTILCIGEEVRDRSGNYLRFIQKQLHDDLGHLKKSDIKKLVVAYEPIWAIGPGKRPPEVHEIAQTTLYVKKVLIHMFGKKAGDAIPILYGGSTDAENAASIVHDGGVDGLLVGRSSLNPHEFADMITAVAR